MTYIQLGHLHTLTYTKKWLYLWYPSFIGVGQAMKQTKLYLWYPSFIGVGQGMKMTKHQEMKDITNTAWSVSYLDLHQ
jgi:hypothetical protein